MTSGKSGYRFYRGEGDFMTAVNVRYIVDDVDAAVAFYTTHLGFTLLSNASPAFADVNAAGRPTNTNAG
jgi:catechol 2,3-dioxygenase-like lactoylglutathione lyase family enzyme